MIDKKKIRWAIKVINERNFILVEGAMIYSVSEAKTRVDVFDAAIGQVREMTIIHHV